MLRLLTVVSSLLLVTGVARAQSAEDLTGVYERVSLTNTTSGLEMDPGQRGLLIMARGHYTMMTIRPDRPALARGEQLTDKPAAEQIAFLQTWLQMNAHAGRYEVDEQTLVWHRDINEDPAQVETTSRLAFERRDDLLVISFGLPNGDRYEWVWRKIR
ncbi:MAG: lipocalin-like domain-containing protein [Vicinamibacterales bacterium]|jgi:hypothetical protein|nr:hypothetical protein [Acidobacteriota bacterium]MDP6371160.1 lipocalin-like domain-containing protein [Vicinamibacterales bacterium]MDP6609796.1 lipocalin-like domain-containing protein [Vicinamibacterales bacterium]HAK54154.1 hypothetical protein [Acidobacteriota bacterium]|tara:strand:+ start:576 stop:1049 length:474 start_codon:yes stop_codon:yes gene_type:complete